MIQAHRPLENMFMNQPYGVNWVREGFYRNVGIPNDLHNGWDCHSPDSTPAMAVFDGKFEYRTGAKGLGNYGILTTPYGNGHMKWWYGHLKSVIKEGEVKRGEKIVLCDNTGNSTGSHLHIMTRLYNSQGRVINYSNGSHGMIDPSQFFPKSMFYGKDEFKLPVDDIYGRKYSERSYSQWEWYKIHRDIYKKTRKLMSTRQKKAIIWGFWGVREVRNPAMYENWSVMTKPEYLKRTGQL